MVPDPKLLVFLCSIGAAHAQQRLGVAIGNGNNPDVVRREHYEYHPPGAHNMHRRRHAGPFDGIIPGVLLTAASSALQWWNEGRAVRDARMLSDARKQVVELDSNAPINSNNDGKLIHITGQLTTEGGIVDPVHGLHRPKALQLVRTTEAYQWREQRSESRTRVSERETRVQVEYRYHKSWTTRSIDSNQFESPGGHFNPYPRYRLGRDKLTAHDVRLVGNGFSIDPTLVDQIANRDLGLSLSSQTYNQGHHEGSSSSLSHVMIGRGIDLPNTEEENAVIVSSTNTLYFSETRSPLDLISLDQHGGGGPSRSELGGKYTTTNTNDRIAVIRSMPRPDVGDVRVSWKEVTNPPNGVSILAKQQGDRLVPWKHGEKGHQIYSLYPGKFSALSMLEDFVKKNKFITKVLRFGGWFGGFLGLNLVLSCIPALVKLLPLGVGRIPAPLAQIATSTIAMGVSVGLSAAVISVAWVRFRPILATGLAIVSGVGFFGPFFYARAKRSPEVKEMDEQLYGSKG